MTWAWSNIAIFINNYLCHDSNTNRSALLEFYNWIKFCWIVFYEVYNPQGYLKIRYIRLKANATYLYICVYMCVCMCVSTTSFLQTFKKGVNNCDVSHVWWAFNINISAIWNAIIGSFSLGYNGYNLYLNGAHFILIVSQIFSRPWRLSVQRIWNRNVSHHFFYKRRRVGRDGECDCDCPRVKTIQFLLWCCEGLESHRSPASALLVAAVVVRSVLGEHGYRWERVLLDELERRTNLERDGFGFNIVRQRRHGQTLLNTVTLPKKFENLLKKK